DCAIIRLPERHAAVWLSEVSRRDQKSAAASAIADWLLSRLGLLSSGQPGHDAVVATQRLADHQAAVGDLIGTQVKAVLTAAHLYDREDLAKLSGELH